MAKQAYQVRGHTETMPLIPRLGTLKGHKDTDGHKHTGQHVLTPHMYTLALLGQTVALLGGPLPLPDPQILSPLG
jgi:hypothetical protein